MENLLQTQFLPHKTIIWNNENIIKCNKSIYLPKWKENQIVHIQDLFNHSGQLENDQDFITNNQFPITSKEYNYVFKTIPAGICQWMKTHRKISTNTIKQPILLDGININNKNVTAIEVQVSILKLNTFTPRCKSHWTAIFTNLKWDRVWLNPDKLLILNKIKETQWKILHLIYPTNLAVSKFSNQHKNCSFCLTTEENINHLFYECQYSK